MNCSSQSVSRSSSIFDRSQKSLVAGCQRIGSTRETIFPGETTRHAADTRTTGILSLFLSRLANPEPRGKSLHFVSRERIIGRRNGIIGCGSRNYRTLHSRQTTFPRQRTPGSSYNNRVPNRRDTTSSSINRFPFPRELVRRTFTLLTVKGGRVCSTEIPPRLGRGIRSIDSFHFLARFSADPVFRFLASPSSRRLQV